MTTTKEPTLADELERLVDRHTLTVVLRTLTDVCDLKAGHVEHAWQDKLVAKNWRDAARRLNLLHDVAYDRCL